MEHLKAIQGQHSVGNRVLSQQVLIAWTLNFSLSL